MVEQASTMPGNGEEPQLDADGDVIADAIAYLELCIKSDDRAEALDDLKFLNGNHWPEQVVRERELDRRPCLTINKLPTFLHQVTNNQRMNVPSIKVSPVGEADAKTAEVLQGMIRHIEYATNADVCYDTAVNSAAAIGRGFFRLVTDYCNPRSFDQELRFERIRNTFTVYFDPTSLQPDGSDQKRCMISVKQDLAEFKREHPKAQVPTTGFRTGIGDRDLKNWASNDFVRVAEFYRIEEEEATLLKLSNGETGFEDELVELPPGISIVDRRQSMRPKVMWYKLTCLEVLEKTEIKCRWIPVFPVWGDELDIDGTVVRNGIIRHAKDPSKMYDYWMTSATEEVALRQRTPYIGAVGQFEDQEDKWNEANVRSFSYVEYNPVGVDGVLAPPPQRQPMADIPAGMLTMAMHANDNIKATTGLFDSSLGAMGNARSGTQERSQQRQGDIANFHYSDNLNRTVRHVGRVIIDMIPSYYTGQRMVAVMAEDDKISSATLNQPVQEKNELGQVIEKIINDPTVGEYHVVVKAGPSYNTLREEAADSMVEVGKSWPKLMEVAGDKVIRSFDWPGAEEIADRVAKTIPPELRDDEDQEDQQVVQTSKGPVPVDQVGPMLESMNAQMQEMAAALQEAQSGIAKAQVDAEAKLRVAQLTSQAQLQASQLDAETQIKVAELRAVSASDVAELNGLIKLLVEKMQPPPGLEAKAMETGANGV